MKSLRGEWGDQESKLFQAINSQLANAGGANVKSWQEDPEATWGNLCWEFTDGQIKFLKDCDKVELRTVIEALRDCISLHEKREKHYQETIAELRKTLSLSLLR